MFPDLLKNQFLLKSISAEYCTCIYIQCMPLTIDTCFSSMLELKGKYNIWVLDYEAQSNDDQL